MAKYANFTGLVTLEKDSQGESYDMRKQSVSLREGDIYQDDDPIVVARPEYFIDTEPNSQVAGAFPMEGTLRNSSLNGDVVEEKRWEGERPPGYEVSGEDRSPTAADELREEGEPARKRSTGAGQVERATAAPGEKRANVARTPVKGKDA